MDSIEDNVSVLPTDIDLSTISPIEDVDVDYNVTQERSANTSANTVQTNTVQTKASDALSPQTLAAITPLSLDVGIPFGVVERRPRKSTLKHPDKWTSVQKAAAHTIWGWFRWVVPERLRYKRIRKWSVWIQSTWRMCITRTKAKQHKRAFVYVQSLVRRWLQQSAYQSKRKAVLHIHKWFRWVVPERLRYKRIRKWSVWIQSTRRMCIAIKKAKQHKRTVLYVQSLVRRWLQQSAYQSKRNAVLHIQKCYRSSSRAARYHYVLSQLRTCRATRRATSQTLAEVQHRIHTQEGWTECPITQDWIREPVLNLGDGHLYEREALAESLRRVSRSPLTREPNHPQLCQTFLGCKQLYAQSREDGSRLRAENTRFRAENTRLRTENNRLRNNQRRTTRVCPECSKSFATAESCLQHMEDVGHN